MKVHNQEKSRITLLLTSPKYVAIIDFIKTGKVYFESCGSKNSNYQDLLCCNTQPFEHLAFKVKLSPPPPGPLSFHKDLKTWLYWLVKGPDGEILCWRWLLNWWQTPPCTLLSTCPSFGLLSHQCILIGFLFSLFILWCYYFISVLFAHLLFFSPFLLL